MKATLLITTALCSLMSLSSCKSTQETAKEEITTSIMDKKETILKEGYTVGTIVHSTEEGDCEWTIKLEDGRHFESLSMKDEYKKSDLKVYFKFLPQRRMSTCSKASPVQITDMISVN